MNDEHAPRSARTALIIGGGIGGPVLAMWLRRIGMQVTIAEARPGASLAEGAFLGVAPNGMNALAALDLAEAVRHRGFACRAFRFTNRSGKTIGTIDRSQDEGAFGYPLTMIRRSDLHVVLAEEAAARGATLLFGKRLVALDRPRESGVMARFADGSQLEADIVVGCDGLGSTVRRAILPKAPAPRPLRLLDCGGFVPTADVPLPTGVNEMVFGRRAFFGAFRTDTGEVWWFHNGPLAPRPLDEAALRARLLELHADDPPWIGELIARTPALLGPWPLQELAGMPRWWDGHVCLLGDAAHAMSPSAGQGASMALEDALVLARCLRDHPEPTSAFAAFEAIRRPRVDALIRFARHSNSGKTPDGGFAEWLRDRLFPIFLRFGEPTQTRSYAHRLQWE